jgi:hypothetical protein
VLLNLIEVHLPTGQHQWDNIQSQYNGQIRKGWPYRDVDSIRRKFNTLRTVKKPTGIVSMQYPIPFLNSLSGEADCPEEVVRAKRAQRQIEEKHAVTNLDDDDFDADGDDKSIPDDLSLSDADEAARRNLENEWNEASHQNDSQLSPNQGQDSQLPSLLTDEQLGIPSSQINADAIQSPITERVLSKKRRMPDPVGVPSGRASQRLGKNPNELAALSQSLAQQHSRKNAATLSSSVAAPQAGATSGGVASGGISTISQAASRRFNIDRALQQAGAQSNSDNSIAALMMMMDAQRQEREDRYREEALRREQERHAMEAQRQIREDRSRAEDMKREQDREAQRSEERRLGQMTMMMMMRMMGHVAGASGGAPVLDSHEPGDAINDSKL